jgi:hypothetical protein
MEGLNVLSRVRATPMRPRRLDMTYHFDLPLLEKMQEIYTARKGWYYHFVKAQKEQRVNRLMNHTRGLSCGRRPKDEPKTSKQVKRLRQCTRIPL